MDMLWPRIVPARLQGSKRYLQVADGGRGHQYIALLTRCEAIIVATDTCGSCQIFCFPSGLLMYTCGSPIGSNPAEKIFYLMMPSFDDSID